MKTLTSAVLENSDGNKEVKIGDKVSLLNPSVFSNPVLVRTQNYINKNLKKEIGKPPYEVISIFQEDSIVYLKLKGKKGIKDKLITQYFTYNFKYSYFQ